MIATPQVEFEEAVFVIPRPPFEEYSPELLHVFEAAVC